MMPDRAETEVWFRNPGNYVRELAEVGAYNVTFDVNYLHSRRILPTDFCNLYFGASTPWRCLVIHQDRTVMYECGSNKPTAIWPTWSATTDSMPRLARYMRNPWGSDSKMYDNDQLHPGYRPIKDQRHIIVITDLPQLAHTTGKVFMEELSDFQAEHPEVKFFLHGLYSYQFMFGKSFQMVDVDPRNAAGVGRIILPGGPAVRPGEISKGRYWMDLLGYSQSELTKDPKLRCQYNIKSAIFAGSYWKHLFKFTKRSGSGYNWCTDQIEAHLMENSTVFTRTLAKRPGDRVVCDDCSIWLSCKYFREGAVCAVPQSDMAQIAEMFGTRDSSQIQKALAKLVQANTDRIDRGMRAEATPIQTQDGGQIDKPVDANLSKLIADTFKMGNRLLEIVDPAMRPGKPAVNVNVGGTAGRVEITAGGGSDEQRAVANVVAMLEARGYTRDQITPDLVKMAMHELAGGDGPKALEGEVA